MDTATKYLIDRTADFTIDFFDEDGLLTRADARTLAPETLNDIASKALTIADAAVCHYVLHGDLLRADDDVAVWLCSYRSDHGETRAGLRDTLAKLTGESPIPGVSDALTPQDRLDAWSVHTALFGSRGMWFPWTVTFDWLVGLIRLDLQDEEETP